MVNLAISSIATIRKIPTLRKRLAAFGAGRALLISISKH